MCCAGRAIIAHCKEAWRGRWFTGSGPTQGPLRPCGQAEGSERLDQTSGWGWGTRAKGQPGAPGAQRSWRSEYIGPAWQGLLVPHAVDRARSHWAEPGETEAVACLGTESLRRKRLPGAQGQVQTAPQALARPCCSGGAVRTVRSPRKASWGRRLSCWARGTAQGLPKESSSGHRCWDIRSWHSSSLLPSR